MGYQAELEQFKRMAIFDDFPPAYYESDENEKDDDDVEPLQWIVDETLDDVIQDTPQTKNGS